MRIQKLSLDTKISTKFKDIEIGEILITLNHNFPDGFYSQEGTNFLNRTCGEPPEEFRESSYSNSYKPLFIAMKETNFLESKKIPPKSEGKKVKYFYTVNQNALKVYNSPDPFVNYEYKIPNGLAMLMKSYATLLGTSLNDVTKSTLEKIILENKKFLNMMRVIKEESPEGYAKMGGKYLDKLI